MNRKLGRSAPLGEEELVPIEHNVARAGPTCTPSFILIRPTVSPQYTNVTDKHTGQTDNGLIA